MSRRKTYTAEQVDDALARWVGLLPAFKKARAAANEAIARMPWWAQPGPTTVCSDGRLVGGISWMPAIQEFELPQGMVQRTLRPGKWDFEQRRCVAWGNQEGRDRAYERQIAILDERILARDAEMEKAGVVKARAAETKIMSAQCMAVNPIFWGEPSPYALALHAIVDIAREAIGNARWRQQSEFSHDMKLPRQGEVLRHLMPILPPTMVKVASRLIKTGVGPMTTCPYWIGQLPDYGKGGRPPADMIEALRAGLRVGPRYLEAAE